jgi:hypothetical protein
LGNETTIEEEEDVSRGDILDFMTPRDISRMRYEQHHEWMEEVLESPYSIYQIVPGDLGLGRKGEVEELTKDFFDAPVTALRETSGNTDVVRAGNMEKDKAADFRRRATKKIAEMQAEIEHLKVKHSKRIAKMQRTTTLNSAEKKLRAAQTAAVARRMSSESPNEQVTVDVLDEIAADVERSMGKKIERVANVTLVSRGGLQERQIERTFSASSATRPTMSPSKAVASPAVSQSALSQQTQNGLQQQTVPAEGTPQSLAKAESSSASESAMGGEATLDNQTGSEEKTPAENDDAGMEGGELLDAMEMDVDMDALVNDPDEENTTPAGNEWVLVNDQEEKPATDAAQTSNNDNDPPESKAEETRPVTLTMEDQSQPPPPQTAEQPEDEHVLDDNDFGGDFDNVEVDTAGDALASYGDENDEDDLNLDAMDDSAFGDAFHPDEDVDIS